MQNQVVQNYRIRFISPVVSRAIKRLFDIFVSLSALVILVPIFGILAIAIKRDSLGPVFYGGERVGKGGKVFRIWKFRTMYEDRKSYEGPRVTAKGDERITPVGKWLRDTKLNELPQFLNVLIGDMSMVGPRPEDPSFAATWSDEVRSDVLSVKPGITSPATVVYHDEESILNSGNLLQQYIHEIGPDKSRLDQLYVRYRSFMLDLDVILWTSLILLPKIRSNTPPEEMLFVGPISRLVSRHMTWVSIDLLLTFLAISLIASVWTNVSTLEAGLQQAISMALVFSVIFTMTGYVMRVNRISWSRASFFDIFRLFPAWFVATAIALFVNWSLNVFPAMLILIASITSLAWFIFARYSSRMAVSILSRVVKYTGRADSPRERVIIVGSGRTAEHISGLLDHPSNVMKYHVVGIVDDDFLIQGMSIYGKKVLGRIKDFNTLVQKHQIKVVFLASHTIDVHKETELTEFCSENAVKAIVIPDIFGSIQNLVGNASAQREQNENNLQYACIRCSVNSAEVEIETHS